ncbi:MAG: hypothetical protein HFJ08_16870 [Lachnospiraceae bacterium]|jgi:hypothetical protein|nr:hypothetical protein [Lachnospiraceae bacterium]
MMNDDLRKDELLNSLKEQIPMNDDIISRSVLLSDLKKQISDVENVPLFMEIVENQPPADSAEYGKILLVRDLDKERFFDTILFIVMIGIIIFLKVVLNE